jgi:tetratricopeptide (TPR) repeat protein
MAASAARTLFEQGLALHQAGRIEVARGCYEQALAAEPEQFDALHMLGVVCLQTGQTEQGAVLLERAVGIDPNQAAAHLNLGMAQTALKRFDAAIASCERAVALQPGSVEGYTNLGNAQLALGRFEAALASYDRALALNPAFPAGHYNRANALRDLGRLDMALESYDKALVLKPDFLEAHVNRGNVLERLDRQEDAVRAFDAAIAVRPTSAEAHSNRAKALNDLKRSEEALPSAERAIALRPDYAEAHNHQALALYDLRRMAEALAACDQAIALDPEYAEAHNNRGIALFDLRRLEEALASYDRALILRPDFPEAHLNRATSLLSLGDLQPGFQEYRWRWRTRNFRPLAPRLHWSAWEGEDFAGKSILLHGEQGFGDHLQFVRYAPLVAARAGRVTLLTEPPLVRLFRSIPEIDVTDTLPGDAVFDIHAPLMDLPRLFGTTLATVPAATPYLAPDAADLATWSERLSGQRGLKVGLVWAGDTHKGRPAGAAVDRRRSLRLEQFAPLSEVENVTFYSLQKGEPAAQASHPPPGLALIDLTAGLRDFADTAALIANLDLVIAVDTAVAHLAGALGKPVWILSRYEGDWRWLNGREDSPWYPTARVFHQRAAGAWDEVVDRVVATLAARR